MTYRTTLGLFALVLFLVSLTAGVSAMPPHPNAYKIWERQGVLEEKLAHWQAFKEAGGCAPAEISPLRGKEKPLSAGLDGQQVVDTLWIPVILVDFSDWEWADQQYNATPAEFDSLLFSQIPGSGSMTQFYLENTYGRLLIMGEIFGPYRMPQTYAWYEGGDDGLGGESRVLAGYAVDSAHYSGNADWAKFANGDSRVDGVIVIHAGRGAETGAYGIWSHRSVLSNPRTYDGKTIADYTINPEQYGNGLSTVGVFGHEYGHIFALPDLYDINADEAQRAAGLGTWSMMSGGSWNGSPSGSSPSHFDPWCKMMMQTFIATQGYTGFKFFDVVWLESNVIQAEIPQVESVGKAYALGNVPGQATHDYWMVENRQHVGFDAGLAGHGLCIYHVDPAITTQSNRFHYMVALEQADGLNELSELRTNGSDFGDTWPGATNHRDFHDFSVPNSRTYYNQTTEVGVWRISDSDSLMYADLDVTFSRPWVIFASTGDSIKFVDTANGGNGNHIPEPGETIDFYFKVVNIMGTGYDPTFTLSSDISELNWVATEVPLKSKYLGVDFTSENVVPIRFTIPKQFVSRSATFTLTVTSDIINGSGDRGSVFNFEFPVQLGPTQVLLVDDDGGADYEEDYQQSLDRLQIPYDTYTKTTQGSPAAGLLADYETVIWFTGANMGGGGSLTSGDVQALESFLGTAKGNLFMSSMTAASQLQTLDSAFMADYLHANFTEVSPSFGIGYVGETGSTVGEGVAFWVYGSAPINPYANNLIAPVGGAEAAFYLAQELPTSPRLGTNGVSFADQFRTVFVTFGFEFLDVAGSPSLGVSPADSLMQRVFDFFRPGMVTDVPGGPSEELLPEGFALAQNYPNPFNPSTTIQYTVGGNGSLKEPVATRLVVYNALGRRVKTLVDKFQLPGTYSVVWDGRNEGGKRVASGVYLYRLESGNRAQTKKAVLLK
jgi:M6 family metalloprotease-like protein